MGEGSGLTNAVGVLLNTAKVGVRKIEVDDVHHILDVETAGGDSSSDEDTNGTDAERTNGILTLALGAIRVDRRGGHANVVQVVVELVGAALAVDKHDGTGGGTRVQQVEESLALGRWLDVDDVLLDVGGCGSSTSDADADEIVGEMLLRKIAGSPGEGRGEHHVRDVAILLVCENVSWGSIWRLKKNLPPPFMMTLNSSSQSALSISSASSTIMYLRRQRERRSGSLVMKSTRRPGVPMRTSQPLAIWLSWSRRGPPPYTTHGRSIER